MHFLEVQRKEHEKNEKREKKKKEQPNLLTCESHFFTNWTLKLDPMPLHTLIVPVKNMFF
jgi:hypothetical protein